MSKGVEYSEQPHRRNVLRNKTFWAGTVAGGALMTSAIGLSLHTPAPVEDAWNRISGNEQNAGLRLDATRPTPETISRLQEDVVRIRTTVDPSYQHYGFFGSNCTGFVIRDKEKLAIMSARHCFPDTLKAKDGTVIKTKTKEGKSIIQAQATNSKGETVDVTPGRYFDIQEGTNSHLYDVLYLGIRQQEGLKNEGITVTEEKPLTPGQHLTLLSIDSQGNQFINSLFYINESEQGTHLMLAFEKLTETCTPGQSGSGIFDNSGKLRGVFTETSEFPFKITPEYAQKHNLPAGYVGKGARECYAVGIPQIQGLLR